MTMMRSVSSEAQTAHGVQVDEYFGDDDGGIEQNEEVEEKLQRIAVQNSQRLTATSAARQHSSQWRRRDFVTGGK